jgi:hypothetical protein
MGSIGETAMSRLIGIRSQRRTEAQAFFADTHPFPLTGTTVGLIALANIASAIASLLPL